MDFLLSCIPFHRVFQVSVRTMFSCLLYLKQVIVRWIWFIARLSLIRICLSLNFRKRSEHEFFCESYLRNTCRLVSKAKVWIFTWRLIFLSVATRLTWLQHHEKCQKAWFNVSSLIYVSDDSALCLYEWLIMDVKKI